jgi:glycosyltransferase involved in cell wall biosynthesis
MQKPWISILIPAYEEPVGIQVILDHLEQSKIYEYECLIYDDSESEKVSEVVKSHRLFIEEKIKYRKNINNQGAVSNWNSLIQDCEGEYFLFMHHDECPLDFSFFEDLKKFLKHDPSLDLIILRSALVKGSNMGYKFHMPHYMTSFILDKFPQYLFRRNLIGSPSNIVVRKSKSSQFNPELSWLVDVDWFYRQLSEIDKWSFCKDLIILSNQNNQVSITKSMRSKIPEIRMNEILVLSKVYKDLGIFKLLIPNTLIGIILFYLEQFFWASFRGTRLITDIFSANELPYRFNRYKNFGKKN